jgi:hypothetical protein
MHEYLSSPRPWDSFATHRMLTWVCRFDFYLFWCGSDICRSWLGHNHLISRMSVLTNSDTRAVKYQISDLGCGRIASEGSNRLRIPHRDLAIC